MKSTTQLEALSEQFSHWRSTRARHEKTPLHLIQGVLDLVNEYPKSKIVQMLGINSSVLKRWERQFNPTPVHHDFVEISNINTAPAPNVQLELQLQIDKLSFKVSGTDFELASFVKQLTLGK